MIENLNTGVVVQNLVLGISWLVIIGLLALLGWYIWLILQYKVRFIVRVVSGDRTLIIEDKARIIKKKAKPIRWKLWKQKDFVPIPPKEAIEISKRGKQFVEAYYTVDGEYIYLEDKLNNIKKVGSLNPLTAADKEFYVQQLEEAKKYDVKTWTDIVMAALPIMAIVIILVVFFVFFDEAVAPTIELGNSLTVASNRIADALNTIQGVQTIDIPAAAPD